METAEQAWHRIATRKIDHPLEKIGRRIFEKLTEQQWLEILAAVCKNNLENSGRVPDLLEPFGGGTVQDDASVFSISSVYQVESGGKLVVSAIKGGFKCKWAP